MANIPNDYNKYGNPNQFFDNLKVTEQEVRGDDIETSRDIRQDVETGRTEHAQNETQLSQALDATEHFDNREGIVTFLNQFSDNVETQQTRIDAAAREHDTIQANAVRDLANLLIGLNGNNRTQAMRQAELFLAGPDPRTNTDPEIAANYESLRAHSPQAYQLVLTYKDEAARLNDIQGQAVTQLQLLKEQFGVAEDIMPIIESLQYLEAQEEYGIARFGVWLDETRDDFRQLEDLINGQIQDRSTQIGREEGRLEDVQTDKTELLTERRQLQSTLATLESIVSYLENYEPGAINYGDVEHGNIPDPIHEGMPIRDYFEQLCNSSEEVAEDALVAFEIFERISDNNYDLNAIHTSIRDQLDQTEHFDQITEVVAFLGSGYETEVNRIADQRRAIEEELDQIPRDFDRFKDDLVRDLRDAIRHMDGIDNRGEATRQAELYLGTDPRTTDDPDILANYDRLRQYDQAAYNLVIQYFDRAAADNDRQGQLRNVELPALTQAEQVNQERQQVATTINNDIEQWYDIKTDLEYAWGKVQLWVTEARSDLTLFAGEANEDIAKIDEKIADKEARIAEFVSMIALLKNENQDAQAMLDSIRRDIADLETFE